MARLVLFVHLREYFSKEWTLRNHHIILCLWKESSKAETIVLNTREF